jgi:protoporphyrinogen oxidase
MNTILLNDAPQGEQLTPRDQETQAAIWALLFLVSEVCLALRVLRDRLHARGALLPEDEELVNQAAANQEKMAQAYQQIEKAFREKFARVQYAQAHPEKVEQTMREAQQRLMSDQGPARVIGEELEGFGNTAGPEEPVDSE